MTIKNLAIPDCKTVWGNDIDTTVLFTSSAISSCGFLCMYLLLKRGHRVLRCDSPNEQPRGYAVHLRRSNIRVLAEMRNVMK